MSAQDYIVPACLFMTTLGVGYLFGLLDGYTSTIAEIRRRAGDDSGRWTDADVYAALRGLEE